MESYKRYRYLFVVMFLCFALSSLSVTGVLIVTSLSQQVSRIVNVVIASVFWLGIIAGIILSSVIDRMLYQTKRQLMKSRYAAVSRFITGRYRNQKRLPGILTLSGAANHVAIYAIFLIGLGLSISDIMTHWIPEIIMFPIISITIFAFEIHCVIDGKNYKVYRTVKEGLDNGN